MSDQSVKIVQILSYFWAVFSRIQTEYGPEISPYLDTFHAMDADYDLHNLKNVKEKLRNKPVFSQMLYIKSKR